MKRTARLWLLPGLLAGIQCAEVNAPARENAASQDKVLPPLTGLIVSGPTLAGSVATAAARDAGVTYLSVSPGTLPIAARVEIRNRTRNGPRVSIATVDGGFDPVAIEAIADDQLDVTVIESNGLATVHAATVPRRRPPSIVRTNPPKGRSDVALKIHPLVVFSEPIDPATLSPTSVRLLESGALVSGTVALEPGSAWAAHVIPTVPFKPGTTYQLLVTQDVRDLDGDALDAPVVVEFTTENTGFDVEPTGRITFATEVGPGVGGYIYAVNPDGSGLMQLPGGQAYYSTPRLSPDGRRIVVGRSVPNSGVSGIYVIDLDGASGLTRLADGWDPAWSPDGSKIAFTANVVPSWPSSSIHVMNADGSGVTRLTSPNDPAQCSVGSSASDHRPDWSPDGRRIVFQRDFHTGDSGFDCGLDGWGFLPQIHVINADGTALRRLMSNSPLSYNGDPTWSPDGRFIAYWINSSGVGLIDSDGVGPGDALVANTVYGMFQLHPAWAPEGKHLVFLGVSPPNNRLFILELASKKVLQLSVPSVPGLIHSPSWGRAR